MTKGAIADSLATSCELKKSVVTNILGSMAEVGTAEVKKTGVFTIPGLARIKTRTKPATKASKKMMFGREVVVKAKPAKTVFSMLAWKGFGNKCHCTWPSTKPCTSMY